MRCWVSKESLRDRKEQVLHSIFYFPKMIVKKLEERLDSLLLTNAKTLPNYNYNENLALHLCLCTNYWWFQEKKKKLKFL